MKKAQAAMEFLMTYGWAILVVLVAIGALAYFGVLSPEKFLPEKCLIASGSGLYCDDFSADTSGVTLRVKNILTDAVNVSTVTLTATGETCTDYTTLTSISADGTADIPVTCTTFASGDKVKGDLSITYNKIGGLSRTTTGTLVTKVP
ncbi:hypothetical protein CMO89_01855 [Candidatus Woesearchaeota archaeon]|nr:hypothetical protein [Candidatus Woesearchaeota archaeon]